jgi:hypothetical protein
MRIPTFDFTPTPTQAPAMLANLGSAFLGGVGQAQQNALNQRKVAIEDEQRRTLANLGQQFASGNADYKAAAAKLIGIGDLPGGLGLLKLGQQQQEAAQQRAGQADLNRMLFGGGQASQGGGNAAPIGNPSDIESRFIGGVRQAGLTNPYGLGAVAATGRAESGFSPRNANRTWSDPSESGQAGTAGGIMSWRADRLQNLYRFAQKKGEQPGNISPETQAAFLASEDPTLIPRLNAAQSPQEASQIMANAWRFAGFNRQGGEAARRQAMTQQYAQLFKGEGGAEQPQTAEAVPMPPRRPMGLGGVDVAMNEADTQRLEAQMAAQQGQPVQMAQNGAVAADIPQGAPAQGFVPPQGQQQPQQTRSALPPGDLRPDLDNRQLSAIIAHPQANDGQRRFAQSILDGRQKWAQQQARNPLQEELQQEQLTGQRLQNEERRRKANDEGAPNVQRIKQPDGSEVAVQWDRKTGSWVPLVAPRGGNAVAAPKLTEAQSKDVGFYNRGRSLIPRLEKQDQALTSIIGATVGQIPIAGNFAKSPAYQAAEQTGRELLAVILRKDTGAAVTDKEMDLYSSIYLPRPGDDAKTIEQKRTARQTAIEGLRMGLGTAEILFRSREVAEGRKGAPQGRTQSGLSWSVEN